jgi:hypothetical protein
VSDGSGTVVGSAEDGSFAGAVVGVAVLAQLVMILNKMQITNNFTKIFIPSSLLLVSLKISEKQSTKFILGSLQ